MKKTLHKILVALLATLTVVCAAVGLAACGGGVKLTELEIVGAKTMFVVGDEFVTGEDFTVYAVYSDGTKTDVTEEAEVKPGPDLNMDVADTYHIMVSWNGKRDTYTIYVSAFEPILRKIDIDASKAKTDYALGESINYDGVKITNTYENGQGKLVEQSAVVKSFNVSIENENGHTVVSVFDELGNYTVTLSLDGIKASYNVTVQRVDISSVQGAVATANAFKSKIASGTYKREGQSFYRDPLSSAAPVLKTYTEYNYSYSFGDNYTYIKETQEYNSEYHISVEDGEIFVARNLIGGGQVKPNARDKMMIDGPEIGLWYDAVLYYGPESVLNALYEAGLECSNHDFTSTVNLETNTFTFSFTGLKLYSNKNDYYETEVEFKLGEDYTLKYLYFDQKCWQNNEGNPNGYAPTFTTVNGITTPNGDCSKRIMCTATQTSGERAGNNPYSPSAGTLKDYAIMYNGDDVSNGVIECFAGNTLNFQFTNFSPSTANFTSDVLTFNYVGAYGFDQNINGGMLLETGFLIFFVDDSITSTGATLRVRLDTGGSFTLTFKTEKIYKTLTFNVIGAAPSSFTANIGNENTQKFSPGNSSTVAIGGVVYFRGAPNVNADYRQTYAVTSGDASKVTIEETTFGGLNCFTFKAQAAGTYVITVSSVSSSSVKCSFTFTVSAPPDFAAMLSGTYTAHDNKMDCNYTVEFTPESATADNVSGTVKITTDVTPNTGDGSGKMQTLRYTVDFDNLIIKLTAVSGDNLGVDLVLDEAGRLALEDYKEDVLALSRLN